MLSEDQVVAESFNKIFINIAQKLKIPTTQNYNTAFIVTNDQVPNTLNKFRNNPSIVTIKNKRKIDQCFSFGPATYDDNLKKTNNLDNTKSCQQFNIPTKILKQDSDYFAECFLKMSINVFQNQRSRQN